MENVWKDIRGIAFHFWKLEREQKVRKCGRMTVARSNMATMMPVPRPFATPSQHLFREIANLEPRLLDNEERGRCPPNSSLRITGSRSTVPIFSAVAPRFTLTKATFLCLLASHRQALHWTWHYGAVWRLLKLHVLQQLQNDSISDSRNHQISEITWRMLFLNKSMYNLLSCFCWKWEKECNNQFTISCDERKIIVVIHAELTDTYAHMVTNKPQCNRP
jgi:hypothetical protein